MFIELLRTGHPCAEFTCGHAAMDAYLRQYAHQNQKRGLGATFVAVSSPGAGEVIGYYTLCASSIARELLPEKHLPQYPIPAILLARLAVAVTAQGQGIARALLRDAFVRVAQGADIVGAAFLLVDPLTEEVAKHLYAPLGFRPVLDGSARLYLPMHTVRRGVSASRTRTEDG